MYVIKVIDKSNGAVRWTEKHQTKECAYAELKHMQDNHFNADYLISLLVLWSLLTFGPIGPEVKSVLSPLFFYRVVGFCYIFIHG